MSKKILCIALTFLLFAIPVNAYYSLDLGIWSSPYHQDKLYTLEATSLKQFHKRWSWKIALKALGPPLSFEPQASLLCEPSLGENTLGKLGLTYNLKAQRFSLEAGLETLADPLLSYCFLSYGSSETHLDLGLVFAVNERWALGAHLQYAQNSLYTYQIHHFSSQGLHSQIIYSRTLDGSLQRLGLKLGF